MERITNLTYNNVTGFTVSDSSITRTYNIIEIFNNKEKYYNIWNHYVIDGDKGNYSYFDIYVVKEKSFWENISYEKYGTIDYWWIIAFFNDIRNPFESLHVGQKLRILKPEFIPMLLQSMRV